MGYKYSMVPLLTLLRGNYERYLQISLSRENNITTGKIYDQVIQLERKGQYLGKTVQVVPHITDAVQSWCERVAKKPVDDTREEPGKLPVRTVLDPVRCGVSPGLLVFLG